MWSRTGLALFSRHIQSAVAAISLFRRHIQRAVAAI
jgi:hypothetical protein